MALPLVPFSIPTPPKEPVPFTLTALQSYKPFQCISHPKDVMVLQPHVELQVLLFISQAVFFCAQALEIGPQGGI